MPDTAALLNTIRATFAEVAPEKFSIQFWFDVESGCGCIIGHSIRMQPLLQDDLRIYPDGDNIVDMFGAFHGGSEEVAESLGISEHDALYLFYAETYGRKKQHGAAGKKEALRRLDRMIAKYSGKQSVSAHDTVAA